MSGVMHTRGPDSGVQCDFELWESGGYSQSQINEMLVMFLPGKQGKNLQNQTPHIKPQQIIEEAETGDCREEGKAL